ncbi:single-stranded DNA-binding protein [Sphingobacterium athyrii]|uniref:Single-stranded DNA-binding protein n=1 Tax=Sphingobacterium athyrii TaxID=2152717 RepID=A0A363NUI0_9SPHI|nr:single-stranded DNA-binding protein [Sphingobacterium athyrii]PUV24383.1 single-stranded DNA-binding protein [Sphingobacterium athyrii]
MNITGRLTQDATVSTTPTGKQVVNFSIAVNDSYKNKDGQRIDQTVFIDCAYWLTAKVAAWLSQGLLVELTGRISARAWLSGDGTAKAGINFHTSSIKPLARPSKKEDDAVQPSTSKKNQENAQKQGADDDLPF